MAKPQINPPQLQQRISIVGDQVIRPSGSLHGQMLAYEAMQRRVNEVELQKYRRFREMIRETTPQQTTYWSRTNRGYCGYATDTSCYRQRLTYYSDRRTFIQK